MSRPSYKPPPTWDEMVNHPTGGDDYVLADENDEPQERLPSLVDFSPASSQHNDNDGVRVYGENEESFTDYNEEQHYEDDSRVYGGNEEPYSEYDEDGDYEYDDQQRQIQEAMLAASAVYREPLEAVVSEDDDGVEDETFIDEDDDDEYYQPQPFGTYQHPANTWAAGAPESPEEEDPTQSSAGDDDGHGAVSSRDQSLSLSTLPNEHPPNSHWEIDQESKDSSGPFVLGDARTVTSISSSYASPHHHLEQMEQGLRMEDDDGGADTSHGEEPLPLAESAPALPHPNKVAFADHHDPPRHDNATPKILRTLDDEPSENLRVDLPDYYYKQEDENAPVVNCFRRNQYGLLMTFVLSLATTVVVVSVLFGGTSRQRNVFRGDTPNQFPTASPIVSLTPPSPSPTLIPPVTMRPSVRAVPVTIAPTRSRIQIGTPDTPTLATSAPSVLTVVSFAPTVFFSTPEPAVPTSPGGVISTNGPTTTIKTAFPTAALPATPQPSPAPVRTPGLGGLGLGIPTSQPTPANGPESDFLTPDNGGGGSEPTSTSISVSLPGNKAIPNRLFVRPPP
jgi:hypothetical protein